MRQLIIVLFSLCFANGSYLLAQTNKQLKSIDSLIQLSLSKDTPNKKKLELANLSVEMSKNFDNDSLSLKANRALTSAYFDNDMYDRYISGNRNNFELAKILNDTAALKVTSSNLGSIYHHFNKNDSAYYFYFNHLKYYNKFEFDRFKANSLISLSDIQISNKAYISAEADAIESIKVLNRLPRNDRVLYMYSYVYNNLGIIFKEQNNLEKSIEYYDRAIEFAEQFDDGFLDKVYTVNNKANAYRKAGFYDKAIALYEGLIPLRSKYEELDPTFYAVVIGNIGKTKLESGDYTFGDIEKDISEAYKTSVELEDQILQMDAGLDIAKLYIEKNKDTAIKYAHESLRLARANHINTIRLDALYTLSGVCEPEEANKHLLEHINLTDSISNVQRINRSKFARIKYDSDQLEAENAQISRENLYLVIGLVGILFTAVSLYIIILQRARYKELRLIKMQNEANEEIYNLMLKQQDKIEEARANEKTRVSKELHDGILGRLFGVRLSLDSLNFSDGKDAIKSRANYLNTLKTIEEDIRKISHDMNIDFISGSGFMDIVSELVETQSIAYGFNHDFKNDTAINWDTVSNKTKINIYRIIQESLQNIYKHAAAKNVKVDLSIDDNNIKLNIFDDGKGFDVAKSKKGIGLKNMTSRVREIRGTIDFNSKIGEGTQVEVTFPCVAA